MKDLKLYLVTDSDILKGRDFYNCIEEALKGGVTMLQLREKNASGKEFLDKAMKLRNLTKKYNVKFIINDRVDIAMLCDADGVHVGQSDIPVDKVRKLTGKDKIIGVSARTVEEAMKAKEDGADYLGVGAMFTTTTKLDAKSVTVDRLSEIKKEVNLPIVAIGGLTLDNIDKLKQYNIDGYAVVSAILKANDIKAFFYVGGNDSMDTTAKLSAYAKKTGIDIKFIGIPKTIDNDLMYTDHTPGFGSAAKFIATSVLETYLDSSVYINNGIFILETMGRDTGWLASAAALAQLNGKQVADFIYLPETAFDIEY